jgi:hypothetical protein
VIERVKWPIDWNRPLSKEECEIAKRLDTAPDVSATNGAPSGVVAPSVAVASQSWHSALGGSVKDARVLQEEKA